MMGEGSYAIQLSAAHHTGTPEGKQDHASSLLAFYKVFQKPAHQGISAQALAELSKLEGRFGRYS